MLQKTFVVIISYPKECVDWAQFSDRVLIRDLKETTEENSYGVPIEAKVSKLIWAQEKGK